MTNRFQGRLRLMTSGLFQIQSSFKVIIFITKYHENVSSMTHIPNGKPNIKTYSSKNHWIVPNTKKFTIHIKLLQNRVASCSIELVSNFRFTIFDGHKSK
jgi:hypothetical protein